MADDPPEGTGAADGADGPILDPGSLDFTRREGVSELGDGRFVVSTDGTPPRPVRSGGDDADPPSRSADAARLIADSLRDSGVDYGVDVTATVDGSVSRARTGSDDVVETFERLLGWYARQVDDDTPAGETLGILLAEADAGVTVPTAALRRAVARHGLSPDDSIGDLFAAAGRENGLILD